MTLVEKLRAAAKWRRRDPAQYLQNNEVIAMLLNEAADEIERLSENQPVT